MKAYVCLAIGALWLAVAIFLSRTGFGIFVRNGVLSPATLAIVFRIELPIIFFGWAVPAALGLYLLLKKR